jgi:hypothetical protein
MKDMKVKLSTLWIFLMFNYLYTDVLTLMDASVLKQLMTGTIDGVHMTQGTLLGAAVLMETAMVMIILSRVLRYKTNRLANIVVGIIHTTAVFASMFVGRPSLHYLFSGVIEIGFSSLVVWYAWNWREPK